MPDGPDPARGRGVDSVREDLDLGAGFGVGLGDRARWVVGWVGEVVDSEEGEAESVGGGVDVDAMGYEGAGEIGELEGVGGEGLEMVR